MKDKKGASPNLFFILHPLSFSKPARTPLPNVGNSLNLVMETSTDLLSQPAIRELIAQGASLGQVTFSQINDLLVDLELDEADVETILDALENRAIPVVDEPSAAPKQDKPKAPKAPKPGAAHSDLDAILSDLENLGGDDDLFSVAEFIAQEEEIYTGEDLDDGQSPVDDALKIYLNRMGQVPRLSPQREHELAEIAHGSDPEAATRARNDLVESNLRLVVHLAKTAATRTSLSITDLLQEGNLGLIDAVERYRPDSNKTFGSYATWWIRRAMNRAITEYSRVMKLSGELYKAIQKLQKAQRELSQKLDRAPTREEIAEATGLSVAQIEEAQRAALQPLSLDISKGGGEDASELGEQLADEDAEVVADAAGKRAVAESLNQILHDLSEREETIIAMRFGLGEYAGQGSRSAEDVAAALKISVARVHELELRALRKLRSKAKGAGLDKLLDDSGDEEG